MMNLHRTFLSVVSVLFMGLGIWLVLQPGAVEDLYPMRLEGPMAVSEIRAVFGGLMLGFGVAVLWLLWWVRRPLAAGMVTIFLFGGLLVGRIVGLVVEGIPTGPVLNETIFETMVFFIVSFTTLKARKRP